jgi:glycyl-tRNA synthetase beta chain
MKELSQSADYTALRTVFKRVMGLSKAHTITTYQTELFEHQEEHHLASKLEQVIVQTKEASGHKGALEALCALKPALEEYFSVVMVMVDDPIIKNNRLSLLKAIATSFFQIADFSLLTGES